MELNLEHHLKYEYFEPYTEPLDNKLLDKDECIKVTGYYLKVPYTTSVSFNIRAINTLSIEAYTFYFLMKYL